MVLCVKGTVPLRLPVSRTFEGSLRDETGGMMREEDRHAADYCRRRIVEPRVEAAVLLRLDQSPSSRRKLSCYAVIQLEKSWKL